MSVILVLVLVYVWVTLIPWACITITSIESSIENVFDNYLPKEKYLLAFISFALTLLLVVITINSIIAWMRSVKNPSNHKHIGL